MIYAQDSISEALSLEEPFWVNIDGQTVTFTKSGKKYEALGYTAERKGSQLDVYENGALLVSILLGTVKRSLKEFPKITCGDCFEQSCVLGTESGGLHLLQGDQTYNLEGHFVYTSLARFFPSGEVALSAGMDYSMKVWDLKTEREVQKLVYQRGMVEDVAMIGRGRNLLSLCKADAQRTVALWEVGTPDIVCDYAVPTAQCLALWDTGDSTIRPPDVHNGEGVLALAGTNSAVCLIDMREEKTTDLIGEGADLVVVTGSDLYRAKGDRIKRCDLRMPNQTVSDIEATATQLTKFGEDVVYRDLAATRFYNQENVLLGGENYGRLVDHYNLGTALREYP